jgi:hypothetical protein
VLPREARPAERPPGHPPGALTGIAAAVAAILAAGILLGCDDDEEVGTATGATNLKIALDGDGRGGDRADQALVRCRGSDSIPSAAACRMVDQLPEDPAAPTPADVPCTEIYGGPDVARIEGTLDGEAIDAELSRANGCEIDRFDRWTPLLRELFPGYRPGEAIAR